MNSIFEKVKSRLEILEGLRISYESMSVSPLDELKKLPRSGKHLRIDKSNLSLPKRSIYDHILSLGRVADIVLRNFKIEIDPDAIADMIAFHDLSESIVGDVPYFTTSDIAKGLFMPKDEKAIKEAQVNNVILDTIDPRLKLNFSRFLEIMDSEEHPNFRFFNFIDRTDPIINIWRYVYLFRSDMEIDSFLEAMHDFFANPKVITTAPSEEARNLVAYLQTKENLKSFYLSGSVEFPLGSSAVNDDLLKELILHPDMHLI